MATLAMVSATLNSVDPMMKYIHGNNKNLEVRNYLDDYLITKVKQEGGIKAESVRRMFDMLSTACNDGADAILLTCTIFSSYAEKFSELLGIPIICPDKAMLMNVAAKEGRKAIVCTFSGTVELTHNLYKQCCKELNADDTVDMIVLDEAYQAIQQGKFEQFNQLIQKRLLEIDEEYDHIILAQISMARVTENFHISHAKLYTSIASAYEEVMKVIHK